MIRIHPKTELSQARASASWQNGWLVRPLLMLALVSSVGAGAWLLRHPRTAASEAHKGLVYTSEGYGGWVAPEKPQPPLTGLPADLKAICDDYRAGKYTAVETASERLSREQGDALDVPTRKIVLQAQLVAAYAAARRHDMALARERFTQVRDSAEQLADHGAYPQKLGEVTPPMEEEAAFQMAVCTGVIGDKAQAQKNAESEYKGFMRSYPDSILIHAAIKRIARLHKGDIPKDAEKVWTQAMAIQKRHDREAKRAASMCAPECLAELLKRQGKPAKVEALATEMKTSAEGTSVAMLAKVASRHGISAQGVELSDKGLTEQKLPLVALVKGSHFVLVEKVNPGSVQVWDPDGQGVGKPQESAVPQAQWHQEWNGIAVRTTTAP